jgi:hypothetical protein
VVQIKAADKDDLGSVQKKQPWNAIAETRASYFTPIE